MSADAPLLVYDGECGFCTRSVRFILRHDVRRRTARFAARSSEAGRAVRERHASVRDVDSLLWVDRVAGQERVRYYSDALIGIAEYLGGPWAWVGAIARLLPRALRDPGYLLIARVRRRLVPGNAACVLPSPAESARMLA